MTRTALIVGASGVVGNAALERFLDEGWDCVAVSRRVPELLEDRPYTHLPLDLTDAAACRAVASQLSQVSHVVYAALHEQPGLIAGWSDQRQMATNDGMLRNLMAALYEAGAPLEHVSLLQGTKAYGIMVAPMRIPAKERQPRVVHDNFYWLQEDFLREQAAERGFAMTIWRPQFIFGGQVGVAMNLVPAIGAYAAIRHHEGLPFAFPGGATYVAEASDARLIASAMHWATGAGLGPDETFNITNGDVFAWRDMWPRLADELGVERGDDEPILLADWYASKQEVWDEVVEKHGLRRVRLLDYLGESRYYADFGFAYGSDGRDATPAFVSTIKLRSAGFADVYDTEDTFAHWFDVLRRKRLLPPR